MQMTMVFSRTKKKSFADIKKEQKDVPKGSDLRFSEEHSRDWPLQTKNSTWPNEATDFLSEAHEFIENRVYLLSAFIGDAKKPNNKYKGVLGLLVWIFNLACHFSLDFYEARFVFHVSWATVIVLYLANFIICTIFIVRHTVPWYVKTVKKLSSNPIYKPTLQRLRVIFKYAPFVLSCLALSGAGSQFGCYQYDGALKLSFGKGTIRSANTTVTESQSTILREVELLFNVLRFTSLVHIYYAMYYYLIMNVIIFFTVVHSQKSFNAQMGDELKKQPPSITFQDAVNKFSSRTKLLRGASSSTTNVLSTLLLTTSISFVVNAYNFLFIQRFAIYVWFAVAPLPWLVLPLIGAAWVTSQYQKYKLIVIQAWVEIPEKYDDAWIHDDRRPNDATSSRKRLNVSNNKLEASEKPVTEPSAKDFEENFEADCPRVSPSHLRTPKVAQVRELGDELSTSSSRHSSVIHVDVGQSDEVLHGNTTQALEAPCSHKQRVAFSENDSYFLGGNGKLRSNTIKPLEAGSTCLQTNASSATKRFPLPKLLRRKAASEKVQELNRNHTESSTPYLCSKDLNANTDVELGKQVKLTQRFSDVANVAKAVGRFKSSRKKFNYEKYIKFLELTLDTIGFSLGKVTITWDRVSFFMVLLLSLVGVFAQNAFLKVG